MNIKSVTDINKIVSNSELDEEAKKLSAELESLTTEYLIEETPKDTEDELLNLLRQYGKEALIISQKIKVIQLFLKKILQTEKTKEANSLMRERYYAILREELKRGYTFVMKLREFIMKEKLGYGLRFSDGKEESLGIFSLEEILPMLSLQINLETQNFSLVFKNMDEINKAGTNLNDISRQFANELNQILQNTKIIRKNVLKRRASIKAKQIEQGIDKKDQISVYYRGMMGFILEKGFIAFAQGKKAERIFDFVTDSDRYSSGGDLQGTKEVFDLKGLYDNLEIKNITQMGASLIQLDTLTKDLEKIAEVCYGSSHSTSNSIQQNLKKLIFKNKQHVSLGKTFQTKIDKIFDENFSKIFEPLLLQT